MSQYRMEEYGPVECQDRLDLVLDAVEGRMVSICSDEGDFICWTRLADLPGLLARLNGEA